MYKTSKDITSHSNAWYLLKLTYIYVSHVLPRSCLYVKYEAKAG